MCQDELNSMSIERQYMYIVLPHQTFNDKIVSPTTAVAVVAAAAAAVNGLYVCKLTADRVA